MADGPANFTISSDREVLQSLAPASAWGGSTVAAAEPRVPVAAMALVAEVAALTPLTMPKTRHWGSQEPGESSLPGLFEPWCPKLWRCDRRRRDMRNGKRCHVR